MYMPANQMWYPVLGLVNSDNNDYLISPGPESRLSINYTGQVSLQVPKIFEAQCQLNLEKFPFDKQTCSLLFYLFYYSPQEVMLERSSIMYEIFSIHNDEWEFLDISDEPVNFTTNLYKRDADGKREKVPSASLVSNVGVRVNVSFSRRPTYYVHYVLLPSLILTFVGMLTPVFPVESESRIGIATSVFLGFIFAQNLIATLIPISMSTPYIANYALASIITSAANLSLSSLLVWVFGRKSGEMHTYIKGTFRVLSYLVCYSKCAAYNNIKPLKTQRKLPTSLDEAYHTKQDTTSSLVQSEELNWKDLAIVLNRIFGIAYLTVSAFFIVLFLFPLITVDG